MHSPNIFINRQLHVACARIEFPLLDQAEEMVLIINENSLGMHQIILNPLRSFPSDL